MNIKEFTDKFPKCPKCKSSFDSEIFCSHYAGECSVNKVYVLKDKIKIVVEDPLSNLKRLDFSVNYDGGAVKVYNATKKSDLDKFKEFGLSFESHCGHCGFNDLLGFSVVFNGKYSPKDFSFPNFGMHHASFTYAADDVVYYFSNNSIRSSLKIFRLNFGDAPTLDNLPFIDLDIFDFSDKGKMKHKLNNITILA